MIGNLNEHGLAIGETTFGGNAAWVKEFHEPFLVRVEKLELAVKVMSGSTEVQCF